MTEPTIPVYGPRTCRRCKGTGQFSNYGGDTRCFDCKGTGVVQVEIGQRPMTETERIQWIDFLHGEAHVENRARDRAARRAAREAQTA